MGYAETLGRIMAGDYDEATQEERDGAVKELISMCAVAAGAVSIQPVPLLDLVFVAPIQVGLVQGIGRIYGHQLDKKAVIEILSTFGASLVAQNVMMASAKLVPFAGWIAAAAMAYALTHAIGEVADHYFRHGRGVSSDDLKTMFKNAYKEKKDEKMAEMREPTLKERLEQLKEAYAAGLIDDDEFEAKKADILAAL